MQLRVVLSVFLVIAITTASTDSKALDKTWDNGGPNNFWDEDDNWDPNEKPQAADKAIVGGNPEVNTLEIFSELENTGTINITTGTLQPQGNTDNSGTINIGDGSAIISQLILGSSTTLTGSGEVVLKNSDDLPASNAVIRGGFAAVDTVTNGANHTVRGEGSVIQHWINDGVFRAEETTGDSSAVLLLDGTTFQNNGELRSTSGATIVLDFATYTQGATGQLIADSDNITFSGVTSVTGGSLESVAGGIFESAGLVTLSGVTVNAPIDNTNTSGSRRLYGDSGGITNNSTITLDGQTGSISQFGFTSSGTLDGTGEVVLVGGDSDTFIGVFPGVPFEFTQGASHTIRGAGVIASPIINNGTIRAEPGTNGNILLVNNPQTNNGLMEAGTGATLEFQSGVSDTVQGTTGIISAADGGMVELENTSITGGRLETTGTGKITVVALSTVNDITNAGNLDIPTFITLRVGGGSITNDGTITINSDSGGAPSSLTALEDTLLDGSGEIYLDGYNNSSRSDVVPNGFTITHNANSTVRGKGQIIGSGIFVNNGLIEGDSTSDPIRIRTRLEGTGTLKNVSIDFDFSGTVHAPGNSVDIVPLEGSYSITHNNVRLEIEIGGTNPGTEHDQLASTGTVNLGGILDVFDADLGNSYVPVAADRFDIITSTSAITGTFNTVNFPAMIGDYNVTWEPIDYLTDPNMVSLEIASAFHFADLNTDGFIDGLDLGILLGNWGASTTPDQGELDGVQPIDGLDLGILLGAWNPPPASATAAVPEPSTLICALIGILGLRFKR